MNAEGWQMNVYFLLLLGLQIVSAVMKDEPQEIDYWRYEQKKQGAKPQDWNIFYYVPRNAIQEEVIEIAALAAVADYNLHSKNRVRRELEGHESDFFMELVPIFEKFKFYEQQSSSRRQTEVIDWNTEKLFILEREKSGHTVLTQVPIDLEYVLTKHEHCLVYDALKKVYVYCEEEASKKQKQGAEELVKILLEQRQEQLSGVVVVANPRKIKCFGELGFHEFIELFPSRLSKTGTSFAEIRVIDDFEHHAGFTLKEIRRIFCQSVTATRDKQEHFDKVVINVNSINYEKVNFVRDDSYCTLLDDLKSKNCYVIDTQSNLGLLVWMGRNAALSTRRKAARMAEKRLTLYVYGTPIIFIDEEDITNELLGFPEVNDRTTINYLLTKVLV